jgi:hypothetical protein
MFNPRFNYCIGDIKSAKVRGELSLCKWLNKVRTPSEKTVKLISSIRLEPDKAKRDAMKINLPSVTPAVRFNKGESRKYTNIKSFTGIAVLDFDKIDFADEFRDYLFETYPFIYATWLSSSAKGCRAIVRIPVSDSVDVFKLRYKALEKIFHVYNGFDTAPKNCVLPLFYSIDAEIKFNLHRTEIFTDIASPDLVLPMPVMDWKRPSEIKSKWAIDNTIKAIDKITDNGHPQLRGASFALGGYVAGGYIDYNDAIDLIYKLIDSNAYLSQKHEIYKRTAQEMIRKGTTKPITL